MVHGPYWKHTRPNLMLRFTRHGVSQGKGNIFTTDIALAVLMSAPRSVASWDIVVQHVGMRSCVSGMRCVFACLPVCLCVVCLCACACRQACGHARRRAHVSKRMHSTSCAQSMEHGATRLHKTICPTTVRWMADKSLYDTRGEQVTSCTSTCARGHLCMTTW